MKIKIKDLHPNPYRNINNYPLDEPKVHTLMESIKQTGFWDNILARQHDGEIQIAYGHHRLAALQRLMDPDYEVDIPVKQLDDAVMIKIMANENLEDWAATPTVIDQTVIVAKQFLESFPEEASKYGQVHKSSSTGENFVGAILIARFLGWKVTKITDSLERLHYMETGEIDQLTFGMFNTDGSARVYLEEIKEQKKAGTPIPKEMHQQIAQKFRDSGNSKKVLKEAVKEAVGITPKLSATVENRVQMIEDELIDLESAIGWVDNHLHNLDSYYKKGIPDQWSKVNLHEVVVDKLTKILVLIDSFIKKHKRGLSASRA